MTYADHITLYTGTTSGGSSEQEHLPPGSKMISVMQKVMAIMYSSAQCTKGSALKDDACGCTPRTAVNAAYRTLPCHRTLCRMLVTADCQAVKCIAMMLGPPDAYFEPGRASKLLSGCLIHLPLACLCSHTQDVDPGQLVAEEHGPSQCRSKGTLTSS